ncbi:Outer membrane lipoprotein omp16 precursor [hydrothermal vent metagenome]|uniref:Outer membrane lipoprotein omp16 n=1 Tax=hydrothermal vent metagenome TaxID=652676 RepID=A0A1W1CL37_9ZZZZ
MKQILWTAAAITALFLVGCGQTAPTLGTSTGKNNFTDATEITGDTVTVNESGAGGSLGNSSSDGFTSVYFNFDDYGISGAMQKKISADVSRASQTSGKIKIEGNCDEFGTDEYNYALGLKRAKAVKDAMISEGVNSSRMVIVSYGESNPVCSSPTDSCYARNRRVDLRLAR